MGGHRADAKAVAEAGAFAVVLEGMAEALAAKITHAIPIPPSHRRFAECDGQVLVLEDMLGCAVAATIREKVRGAGRAIEDAVKDYAAEVRAGQFPGPITSMPCTKTGSRGASHENVQNEGQLTSWLKARKALLSVFENGLLNLPASALSVAKESLNSRHQPYEPPEPRRRRFFREVDEDYRRTKPLSF